MFDRFENLRGRAAVLAGVSAAGLMMGQAGHAAEWELSIGGYFEAYSGFTSTDGLAAPSDGIEVVGDGEVFFRPTITLDNGLKFGAHVEMEALGSTGNHNDGSIDEAYVFVSGSFGTILLGQDREPGGTDHFTAPPAAFLGINSGTLSGFLPVSGSSNGRLTGDDFRRGTLGTTGYSPSGEHNATRISYFTPRFSGFQLGVSYAPEGRSASGDVYGQREEMWDVALRYAGEFGPIRVAAGAFYGIGENEVDPAANPEYQGFDISVSRGNFTIGGSFVETQGSSGTQADGAAYEVGLAYADGGPWSFGINYFHGNNTDNEHTGFGPRERFEMFQAAARYKLKKGVELNIFGAYVDFDEDVGDGGFGTPGDNFDGFVIGTGIGLSF